MKIFSNKFEDFVLDMVTDIRTDALNPRRTVVINMDTINGFFKHGNMYSPRLKEIIPKIVQVNEYFVHSEKIFFADKHTEESVEFATYPPHCMDGDESEVIEELRFFSERSNSVTIEKNSTNAFFVGEFMAWLRENIKTVENFVIVGGATDICVMQFALSLKAYFDQLNKQKNVAVVENAVQTFDSEGHDGDKMHIFAIYNMIMNGVSVYSI